MSRSSNTPAYKAASLLLTLLCCLEAPASAQSPCALDVEVREISSGEPLQEVEVSVLESVRGEARNKLIGKTDALGRVSGSVDHAGNIIVVALNPGHRNGQVSVTSQLGTTQVVLVKVDRGASIVGRLIDKQGQLLRASMIEIEAVPDLGFPGSVLFGKPGVYRGQLKDGRYVVHVPAGRYKLRAVVAGRAVESPTLEVSQRQLKNYDINCQP